MPGIAGQVVSNTDPKHLTTSSSLVQQRLNRCHLPQQVQNKTTLHWAHREAARREAQAEHKAEVLAEENASLILELDSRPTAKQYKSLQRQMDILERKLNDTKHAQE